MKVGVSGRWVLRDGLSDLVTDEQRPEQPGTASAEAMRSEA